MVGATSMTPRILTGSSTIFVWPLMVRGPRTRSSSSATSWTSGRSGSSFTGSARATGPCGKGPCPRRRSCGCTVASSASGRPAEPYSRGSTEKDICGGATHPALTTMHVDTVAMGRAAVHLLSLRLENPEAARMTLTIHPTLLERQSVRDA